MNISDISNKITEIKNSRSGSVMLVVLMVIVMISLIGVLILAASRYNSRMSSNERFRKKAFYIAESGAMTVIDTLNKDKSLHGVVYSDHATDGGSYTVEVFDSTDFSFLGPRQRVVRSVGVSRNAVRRLEYLLNEAEFDPMEHAPGPLYIEADDPHFAGNSFTVQGEDHHWGDNEYTLPVPPGDPRRAITTIHDSLSLVAAMGMRSDQVWTVDDTGVFHEGSIQPLHDTLDLEALAAAYAGPNGELADTTGWIYGSFPGDMKVSYIDGDYTIAGGGHTSASDTGGSCPNCGGTGIVVCWGCDGSGYEWQARSCPKCGGTGKIECTTCAGVGHFECPDCGGTGGNPAACDSCSGSGIYGCPTCEGTGVCPICDGTGYHKSNKTSKWSCYLCGNGEKDGPLGSGLCPDCGGTGGIECPFCGGTGIEPGTGCATCGGIGTITCPDCSGTGLMDCDMCGGTGGIGTTRICHVCGGSGEQTCPWCEGAGSGVAGGSGKLGTLGAGVLVVDGNLHISGQFEFTGIVIVLGTVEADITGGGQGIHIWGSLLCKSTDFKIAGQADLVWCSEALKFIDPATAGYQVVSVMEY